MANTLMQDAHIWRPCSYLGIESPWCVLNSATILYTWITLGILLVTVIALRITVARRPDGLVSFVALRTVKALINLTKQGLGFFSFGHFCFVSALFIFIALCNCLALIPWLEEPTQDINTPLALGIISFIYIQAAAVQAHGLWGYLKEYFTPFFLMFPLHIIGKIASIISISFRLFGNIFGGATIMHMATHAVQGSLPLELLAVGPNQIILLFFGLFEGLLQAFVFTMLTLTYLSIALHEEELSYE